MDNIRYFIEDLKYSLEDKVWLRWVIGAIVVIMLGLTGVFIWGRTGGEDEVAEEDGTEEVQQGDEKEGVSEETLHILMNPDNYDEDKVQWAYQDSLTTFDNQFVEDNVFYETEFENGVYLYHEKGNELYREVAKLSREVSDLGVPVSFYTPQADQSIAAVANLHNILDNGAISIFGIVVRDGEVDEEITTEEGVIKYLGGVLDDNKEE